MRNITLRFCAMLLAICTSTIHLQAMDEWDGVTIAKGFYSGTGTKTNPYKIFTASQFMYFIQQTKDGNTYSGQYIELCNDISFKSDAVIGGDFYGDFDGNDHTIQVNKYWSVNGWRLFDLYGSMHDVQFVRANGMMSIYTGGILYNCRFEFPGGSYHGNWTVYLKGGTIANCVSNSAYYKNGSKYGGSYGLVYEGYGSKGFCSNCYFPITSYSYGNTLASNYHGVIENCGEEAGNDWVLSHTERAYKSWPLTFSPAYQEYQIQEQPQPNNPIVVCPNLDEALFQWYYQERKPVIVAEDIVSSYSTQTKTIVVSEDDVALCFDFKTHGYVSSGRYSDTEYYAWITVNGEEIVSVYKEIEDTYSCQVSAGTYEISCELTDITNIRITYPTDTLANETSSVLSKQTIMKKPGAYFCQVSYGEGCDVMYSDYVDYEKLLTIDNVTYVINEDSTATVLWVADMAVDVTIPETVNYCDVNYPVTSISSKAFVDCTSLASIKCKISDAPTLLGGTTFEGLVPSNATLYVPVGCKITYSAAECWKSFVNIVEFKSTYKATFYIDGEVVATYDIKEGDAIIYPDVYEKEGYSFIWNTLVDVMPSNDININGTFSVNTYTVTYKIDGETYATDSIAYGSEIVLRDEPTKDGYTFSGWSEAPETMPAEDIIINGTFVSTIIFGDVNEDGAVSISDVVATVNYILGKPAGGKFNVEAADITSDGYVSVADIVGIVNIILNPIQKISGYTAKRGAIVRSAERLTMSDVCVDAGNAAIPVFLENATAYTAFQMDVELPEGATLTFASLSERATAGHSIVWQPIADNKVRVVAYSMNNAQFSGNAGELVSLNVQVPNGTNGTVSVDNVRMVTADGIENAISGCGSIIDFNGTTDICDVSAGFVVKVNGNAITVIGANDSCVAVYSINGRLVANIDNYAGEEIVLDKGIYIVRVGNKTMKVNL